MADRKISDLTALTTPASGDYLPIVDISESAAASKNKRITIEELMRGAPNGTAAAPSIAFESDPNTGIYSPGADQVAISTNGTPRVTINSAGNVGIGTTAPLGNLHVATDGESIIIIGNEATNSEGKKRSAFVKKTDNNLEIRACQSTIPQEIIFTRSTTGENARFDSSGRLLVGTSTSQTIAGGASAIQVNSANPFSGIRYGTTFPGPTITYGASRAASQGTFSIANNGDTLANILFVGDDGTAFVGAARITAQVDGTPGANDMPGRLVFSTTADGAASPTERLRITSDGKLGLGTSSPTTLLDVNADTVRVRTARTPASATATGATGEICWDANYIYVCTATNTWRRTAISSW